MPACATPGSATATYPGTVWGAVMANQGNLQFSHGDAESGLYFGVGGQYLTGYNTESNPPFRRLRRRILAFENGP